MDQLQTYPQKGQLIDDQTISIFLEQLYLLVKLHYEFLGFS